VRVLARVINRYVKTELMELMSISPVPLMSISSVPLMSISPVPLMSISPVPLMSISPVPGSTCEVGAVLPSIVFSLCFSPKYIVLFSLYVSRDFFSFPLY